MASKDWAAAEPLLDRAATLDPFAPDVPTLLDEVRTRLGRAPTPVAMLGGRGGRGGSTAVNQAMERGLAWLVRRQELDGRWTSGGTNQGTEGRDVWVTGLAALALLGEGSTTKNGKHRDAVRKAILWLRSQQDEQGVIGAARHGSWLHDHAVATFALTESTAISQSKAMTACALRATAALVAHGLPGGGFPLAAGVVDADPATTLFGGLGLAAAAHLPGSPTLEDWSPARLTTWLHENTDPTDGLLRAAKPAPRSGTSLDRAGVGAGGIFLRCFLEPERIDEVTWKAWLTRLVGLGNPTEASTWFFQAMAMLQVGGRAEMAKQLEQVVAAQQRNGEMAGSWNPAGPIGAVAGRVYATAMHTMALQFAYRYTRLVGRR